MKTRFDWKKNRYSWFLCLGLFFSFSGSVTAKTITLEVGDAEMIRFKSDVSEVFLANPDTADVQLSTPRTLYVFGKTPGTTKLFAVDSKGEDVLKATLSITHNISRLNALIAPYDPYTLVTVKSIPGAIVLEGQADSPKDAEAILAITKKFLGGAQGKGTDSIINRLVVKSPVQVNLRVKIAEVSRKIFNRLGINWQTAGANMGNFNFGTLLGRSPLTGSGSGGLPGAPGGAGLPLFPENILSLVQNPDGDVTTNTIGAAISSGKLDLNSVLDILSQEGYVTILAEPNLVAISGETASFLAGGEFPFPVSQGLGQVTVQFKQYGISLAFTPTVLGGRLINMHVRPEVSELDQSLGVTFNGISIPGILVRRAETIIELGSGQSFAIAGLLKNVSAATIDALPGLGDLPILGPLFRSNAFDSKESEIIILVTPYLVEPVSGKETPLPTDGLTYATFVEQAFDRKILKQGPEKGAAPAYGPGAIRLIGPAGFSIN